MEEIWGLNYNILTRLWDTLTIEAPASCSGPERDCRVLFHFFLVSPAIRAENMLLTAQRNQKKATDAYQQAKSRIPF
jgi:hypothetical protein